MGHNEVSNWNSTAYDTSLHYRLLNYTPAATLVRLFTISAINVYTTSWWLHLSGASSDPRLLLPAWICIASVSPFFTPPNIATASIPPFHCITDEIGSRC